MKVSKEVIKKNREMMGNFMHFAGWFTRFTLIDLVLVEDEDDYIVVCDLDKPNKVWFLLVRDYLNMEACDGCLLYKDLGDEIELPESFYVTKCANSYSDWEQVTCEVTGLKVYDFSIVTTFE